MNIEVPYISKSGRYNGIIVGTGKYKQCLLSERSKDVLARDNLRMLASQHIKPS